MNNLIITVAVTGAETTRAQCPALPHTPLEIAEETLRSYEAGASVVHLHVRKDDGAPTQDAATFARAIELIRARCPILIETTTGGAAGMSDEERLTPVALRPDMASLDCGSCNFSDEVLLNSFPQMRAYASKMGEYGVHPTFECFDLGQITNARVLIEEKLVDPPFHFTFVMGVQGGVPATVKNMLFMAETLPPHSLWTAIAIGGRASAAIHPTAVAVGGNVRVGFEDNIYIGKGQVASGNAELVKRIAEIARSMGRGVAKVDETRKRLLCGD